MRRASSGAVGTLSGRFEIRPGQFELQTGGTEFVLPGWCHFSQGRESNRAIGEIFRRDENRIARLVPDPGDSKFISTVCFPIRVIRNSFRPFGAQNGRHGIFFAVYGRNLVSAGRVGIAAAMSPLRDRLPIPATARN